MYSVIGGLEKLQRDKPSTGFFGNGDVMDGMRALSDTFEEQSCRIRPFVGKVKPKSAMVSPRPSLPPGKVGSGEQRHTAIPEHTSSPKRRVSIPFHTVGRKRIQTVHFHTVHTVHTVD